MSQTHGGRYPAHTTRVIAFLLLWLAGCEDNRRPLPFQGARRLDLECIETGNSPSQGEIEELIDSLLEAYGGKELLENLSFQTKEDMWVKVAADPMSNHADRHVYYRPDQNLRIDVEYRSGKESLLLQNGESYMAARGMDATKAKSDNYQFVLWAYKLHSLPWLLADEDAKVVGGCPQEHDERMLIPLTLDHGRPPILTVWVDPVGPVIRRVSAHLPLRGTILQTLVLDEFQRVEGVLVPFKTKSYTFEEWQTLTQMVEFIVNPDLPNSTFEP